MNPATHFLGGWVLANTAEINCRERAIVTFAGVIPDIDGIGFIPELLTRHSAHPLTWGSDYHHCLHNLAFALVTTALAGAAATRKRLVAVLAFVSFHLHLLCDLAGSRGPDGYQWPIPYLAPFSRSLTLTWNHQWKLNAWPNVVITALLLVVTFHLAWKRGFSPFEMVSDSADRAVVSTLRARFPLKSRGAINPANPRQARF